MQTVVNMWPSIDRGLVVSVLSLLIMVVFQPMVKNSILMCRGLRSVSHALVTLLLAHDGYCGGAMADAVVRPPRRYCERCADDRRGGEDGAAARLSRHDVVAVMESLDLVVGQDEEEEGDEACGVSEAVEELAESKVAGGGELRETFRVFDRDGDGYVSAAELRSVLRRLGMEEGARHDNCVRMIAAHDGDGDGRISFREVRAMMENAV